MLQLQINNNLSRHGPLAATHQSIGASSPLYGLANLPDRTFLPKESGTSSQGQWCDKLRQQLLFLMAWSRYAERDMRQFDLFFDEIVRPFLADARLDPNDGAGTASGSKWLWPSVMTDSHDPVEVGMAWKGGSGPQVRFAIEAIGKSEICDRGSNLSASSQLADALASIGLISRQVYTDLQQTFAAQAKQHSQVFFGFDLNRGGTIDVKLYFVLDSETSSSPSKLASSLQRLDDKYSTTFAKSCAVFGESLEAVPAEEKGHGVIVAFDISGPLDQSRCKLYWRFPTFDIDTVAKRAAYQGSASDQAALGSLLNNCWDEVLNRSNKDTKSLQSLTERKTGGTLVYFDLCDGVRSASKAKVYTSVRHLFEGSTSDLAQRVEDFLIGHSPAVERGLAQAIYESSRSSVQSSSNEASLSGPEEWMTYLCTEVDKSGRPGFCVYFRSCVSS